MSIRSEKNGLDRAFLELNQWYVRVIAPYNLEYKDQYNKIHNGVNELWNRCQHENKYLVTPDDPDDVVFEYCPDCDRCESVWGQVWGRGAATYGELTNSLGELKGEDETS